MLCAEDGFESCHDGWIKVVAMHGRQNRTIQKADHQEREELDAYVMAIDTQRANYRVGKRSSHRNHKSGSRFVGFGLQKTERPRSRAYPGIRTMFRAYHR